MRIPEQRGSRRTANLEEMRIQEKCGSWRSAGPGRVRCLSAGPGEVRIRVVMSRSKIQKSLLFKYQTEKRQNKVDARYSNVFISPIRMSQVA